MRKIGIFFGLIALAAQPALAQPTWPQSPQAPQSRLQLLEQRLAATASDNPGEYGIAALDLASGQMSASTATCPSRWRAR